jgi:hypothetical protein
MSRRSVVVWGASSLVLLAAGAAALINKVDAGGGWKIAATAVVLLWAGVAGWLAWRTDSGQHAGGDHLGARAVKANRDIRGGVNTGGPARPSAVSTEPSPTRSLPTGGDYLGERAVKAGRDIQGDVNTSTTSGDRPAQAPPQLKPPHQQ